MNLEPFVYTAQLQSFTAAARHLGVSVAAVSKAVARLEADLGVQLLVRTSRSVSLTPEGQVWLAHCETALDALAAGRDRLHEARHHVGGRVRVTSSPVLGDVLAKALGALVGAHPHLQLDVRLTDVTESLAADEADVAVRLGSLPDSGLLARRAATLSWCIVASPAYLAEAPPLTDPDELRGHTCLHFLAPDGRTVGWTFAGRAVEVPRSLALGSGTALYAAALAGVGVAQVFRFMARSAIAEGRLVPVLEPWAAPGPPVYVVRRPGDDVPRVRVVTDHLYRELARLDPSVSAGRA